MLQLIAPVISIGTLGTELCLKTMTASCGKLVTMITYMTTHTSPGLKDLDNLLNETDLGIKISTLEKMIQDLEKINVHQYNSVKVCLQALHEVIDKIHGNLETIQKLHTEHQQKWFKNWRSINCTNEMASVRQLSKLIDQRLDLLSKIILTLSSSAMAMPSEHCKLVQIGDEDL